MRLQLAAIVIVGLPAVVAAQTRPPATSGVAPLASIRLPLSPLDLPLSPFGVPARANTPTRSDRHRHRPPEGQHRRGAVYFVPAYGWYDSYPAQTSAPALISDESRERGEAQPPTGAVRLEMQPDRNLQLFVDGYYVGTLDDVGGELRLETGPHRIEMRAPGYETSEVDVRIPFDRSITYRGALKPLNDKPAPEALVTASADVASVTPRTFYLIPGCYVGNVPPKDVNLPAMCDLGRLITVTKESHEP